MSRSRKTRTNAKGRNQDRVGSEERYLSLRRSIWHAPQVSALSTNARALMVELLSIYNGKNNGAIYLGVRDASERLGFVSYQPALDAFRELETVGLISNTVAGSFCIKAGEGCLARAWQLNWLDADGRRAGPETLKPLDMKLLDKKARVRLAKRQSALKRFTKDLTSGSFSVADSSTRPANLGEIPQKGVEESGTQSNGSGANLPIGLVAESLTHILHHGGPGAGPVSGPDPSDTPSKQNGLVSLRRSVVAGPCPTLSIRAPLSEFAGDHAFPRVDRASLTIESAVVGLTSRPSGQCR